MGLCGLGSKSSGAIEDMVAYAQEAQHEKILRGLAVGISLVMYGRLEEASSEQIKHGGCLGLGLAAMGTHRADVYEQLKFCLYQDDAVTGEAAGLAMGLVELGSKSETAIEDMVAYAQDTQHEKILRGLAVGIALVMYGRLEEADPLIESLTRDK